MDEDLKNLKNLKRRFNIFFFFFWVCFILTIIGIICLIIYNENLQKISFSLAITSLGISLSWICLTLCYNIKNELNFDIFKHEIQIQLNRIENKIDK
jgi:uncharacterized membrane protein (DUF485 family)